MNRRTALVFAMADRNHFGRMLPVIGGLSAAGIDTHVFAAQTLREDVIRAGGRFVDLFAEHTVEDADATSIPLPSRYVSFAGLFGDAIVRRAAALKPSLVVHDTFAVIGRVVANHLRVPRVNVCAGHNAAPEPTIAELHRDPRVRIADVCWTAVEQLRQRHGMPDASPFSYVSGVSPDLNLYCEPPQFLRPEERAPFEPIAFFGSIRPDAMAVTAGSPAARSSGRVRFYVSFGTIIWRYYESAAQSALDALTDALDGRSDVEAIVSLGGRGRYEPRSLPANMRIEPYVDQLLVLRTSSVVLTHHGLNSTHEAIYNRVPMISYPFFGDQPGLAARCQELRLAIPLVDGIRAAVTPADIRRALDRIAASRPEMMERLTEAREWELETIRARPAVIARMVELIQ